MKKELSNFILLLAIAISLYGLITGRYLFLFLIIPIGFSWFRSKKNSGE
ncbi:MAG: hypothetical protein KJO49_02885 [Bacteroidia bacterium]|nr:hypothetical protein [Bacteroidia bacterium]MBT8268559.1 hypothetical protein [Bacteroidia bacterium]NNF82113.1 hypothetical protein [Flavobacteriaceae bacterium]NNK70245.1 hypothetical protein [Flavobacteriaceae bacterium]NNL80370.1 hypothetical protein [Flavobacteriaceae bacterium]